MSHKIILFIAVLVIAPFSFGQNATKSIYSSFGLGVLQTQDANGLKGISGSSFGLKPGYAANFANPLGMAGRKAVDFDFGFEFNNSRQQNLLGERIDMAGTVNHISIAFNAWHRKYTLRFDTANKVKDSSLLNGKNYRKVDFKVKYNMLVGAAPFTAMDYDFAVEGDTNTFRSLVSVGGKGGINSVYWNHALQLFDTTTTLGFSYQYLFGTIEESRLKNLLYDSSSVGYQQTLNQRIIGNRLSVSLGKYITLVKAENNDLIANFGFQYTLPTTLNTSGQSITRTVENFFAVKDTLSQTETSGSISLPSAIRGGFGMQMGNKWAFSLDYQNSNFSTFNNTLDTGTMIGLERYSAGIIINPKRYENSLKKMNWYKKTEWHFGGFYQTGPFAARINNNLTPINEYGISFGVALPMKGRFDDNMSYFNANLQYSIRGSKENGLVREDIFRINLAMNINSLWFKKRSYN